MLERSTVAVVIVGAGPYGLAAAAYLRHVGVETRVFGGAMQFWREHMPAGMLLRSRQRSSHIANPEQSLQLENFATASARSLSSPLTLSEFIDYGEWIQARVVPDLDSRDVQKIEAHSSGFELTLEDGEPVAARRVVIAAGLRPFAWRPAPFDSQPRELVSHASDHADLRILAGQNVIVIGGGQSALESAALLHESGAHVEVIGRATNIDWLRESSVRAGVGVPLRDAPPTDVGGRLLGWIVAAPDLYGLLPNRLKPFMRRTYAPAGASWLPTRLAEVPLSLGRRVSELKVEGGRLHVRLNDGTERFPDHVVLGTGYRIDVAQYAFLSRKIVASLRLVGGFPPLGAGLESAVPGLHFLGAPAELTFGPITRFVTGTWFAAPALTRHILGKRRPVLSWAFPGGVNSNEFGRSYPQPADLRSPQPAD